MLKIQSQFNEAEIRKARQRPVRHHLAEVPTMDELIDAIGKLKNGKAWGASGILTEMVKASCCESDFLEPLLNLVQTTWEKGEHAIWSTRSCTIQTSHSG